MAKREPVTRDWWFTVAVGVLTLVALVRVASTHRVFSEVLDEPAHLAAGFEWFEGTYWLDASHPPLARILGALPLRMAGYPTPAATHMVPYGNELYYHGDRYEKTLARTRIGNLLLLAIALVATSAWARRAFSRAVALWSVAILSSIPAVLGHAGVLTTDLAAMAAITLAIVALDRFLEAPQPCRAALLGLALGAGVLSKFSFLVFFPPCALLLLLARRRFRLPWLAATLALGIAFLVFWAGYRFDFRTARAYAGPHGENVFQVASPQPLRPLARWTASNVPLPAPAFFVGLAVLAAHDKEGHEAFFLGETRTRGWWYYFPVLFFYKTPLPFVLLAAWGTALALVSRDRVRILFPLTALAIMAVAMTSSINIGVRHILPLYPPLAIIAGWACVEIWKRATDAFGRAALLGLLLWLFGGVALAHPDYLAWFNETAQPNPAAIAVDSNLDWGQDTLRLLGTLREMKISKLYVDIATNARLEGIEALPFHPANKVTGWLAVSETHLALKGRYGEYAWLRNYRPVRYVGKSIRLYRIP